MRYTVEKSVVQIIGKIWWPYGLVCAQDKTLSSYDLENIGEWTRENVEDWLSGHSGDFSNVLDFRADFSHKGKDWVSEWESEESELTYWDCMDPHPIEE